ncbi:MAG: ATP-binding protein [Clostridiales bacterium]|nr:ATP-binding protein [Clostridiales bacterium]
MDYTLKISPRMLELLSKDLYTNLYFVLAELIANAYDADAENVYVSISDSEIRVEDDGNGMAPDTLNNVYLYVGSESRNSKQNARSHIKKRLKMGRKGIGKLAALSISNGFQLITVQNGIASGVFIPNKIEKDNEILQELTPEDYTLKYISHHGTAVIMNSPKVSIPSLKETVVRNLSRIFPKEISDFTIHINFKGKEFVLKPDEKDIIPRLATLITIGNEHAALKKLMDKQNPNIQYEHIKEYSTKVSLQNSKHVMKTLPLNIHGWIGTYKTTRDMKKEINEFSDNYLAIFAHNKMGQRNILSIIGRNRVYESYVVGNLYIDAFESSEFPDMAGTNRQGYNENDPRWIKALEFIRPLLDNIIRMHQSFALAERATKDKEKLDKQEKLEEQLKLKVARVSEEITSNIMKGLEDNDDINSLVSQEVEKMKSTLGLKAKVDGNKRKIIISQTLLDKKVSDVIYKMLLFNGVQKDEIIYSNCADPEPNIPENDVYGYLQKFFVESASSEKIFVLFVTSKHIINIDKDNPAASWGVLMEIGATWITRKDHWIFNIDDFKPEEPLNTRQKIVEIKMVVNADGSKVLSLSSAMCNSFVRKIIETCEQCGFMPKSFEENKSELQNYVTVFEP